jgi:hypothetical protein
VWTNFNEKIDLIKMAEDASKKRLHIERKFLQERIFSVPMGSEWALPHLMKMR